ncbi:MAG: SEC-C domain-containing protein [Acidobacteria bacterium]|nr:SEC-C domain-containing protein [Acidobacteriota bacterium]
MSSPRMIVINGVEWIFDSNGRFLYPPDPEPSDPCWCESEKKFESCHLNRHLAEPLSDTERAGKWSEPDLRICLHPAAPSGCSKKIARAHSVQRRGTGLASIARDGKIYGFKSHPMFFLKRDRRVVPELVGVVDSSVFAGFCATHDDSLFKPLDTAVVFEPQQLFLSNFRIIAKRYHRNAAHLRAGRRWADMDRGASKDQQRMIFVAGYIERRRAEEARTNLERLKSMYDEYVLQKSSAPMNYLIVQFEGPAEFVASDLLTPEFDLLERPLPPVFVPEHLCLHSIATSDGQQVVFSWIGENRAATQLCQSITAVPEPMLPQLIFRFVLDYVDNIFFAPEWWEALPEEARRSVADQMTARMQVPYRRGPNLIEGRPTLSSMRIRAIESSQES